MLRNDVPPLSVKILDSHRRGKPGCRDALCCICGHDGHGAWRLKEMVCSTLKKKLTADKASRILLETACMVARATTGKSCDIDWTDLDTAFHVGFLYRSPWKPDNQYVEWCGLNDVGSFVVRQRFEYANDYELWMAFVRTFPTRSFRIRLHKLVDSLRPLPGLDYRFAEVATLRDCNDGAVIDLRKCSVRQSVDDALEQLSDDGGTEDEPPRGEDDEIIDHMSGDECVNESGGDLEVDEICGGSGPPSGGDDAMRDC